MVRLEPNELRMPDAEAEAYLRRDLRLDDAALAALKGTLAEGATRWPKAVAPPPLLPKAIKDGLDKIDHQLEKLEQTLSSKDVVDALGHLEAYGSMGFLISSTAALEIERDESEIPDGELEAFLASKKFRGEPIFASDLDALLLLGRQQRLNDRTVDAMRFAVAAMRQPIRANRLQKKQNKGGGKLHRGREMLIFLMARDATKIIGRKATAAPNGPFFRLCAEVFGYCGLSDTGLEEAVERCLKKYANWFEWNELPEYTSKKEDPCDDGTEDIEPELLDGA